MKKIEVLVQLRDVVAQAEERRLVVEVIDELAEAFHGMIAGTRSVLMGEKPNETILENLLPRMREVREVGARYGIELPEIDSMFSLRTYVMEFGMEVVMQG